MTTSENAIAVESTPSDFMDAGSGSDPRHAPTYDLYRRLRQMIVSLEGNRSAEALLGQLPQVFVGNSSADSELIRGASSYRRRRGGFARLTMRGSAGPAWLGETIGTEHLLLREAQRTGWALDTGDGEFATALVTFGPAREFALAFVLAQALPPNDAGTFLGGLRSLAEMALRHRDLAAAVEQAREVQTSLLLARAPAVPGYEVAFASRPAAVVGGDVYDFLQVPPGILGVAVADAAGHGLGAALQARDVIVGLRMGVEENLKLFKTMEKLARVVRRNSPDSRFISLAYAELHRNGHIVYVNAGHPPPLLVRRNGGVVALRSGGPVMGLALLEPRYEPAFETMGPGDLAVFYTDGIVEAVDRADEEFGLERLLAAVQAGGEEPVAELVERVLATVDAFTVGMAQADDQTIVLVRRTGSPPPKNGI